MITTVATHNNMRAIPYSSLFNQRERTTALKFRERIYIVIGDILRISVSAAPGFSSSTTAKFVIPANHKGSIIVH